MNIFPLTGVSFCFDAGPMEALYIWFYPFPTPNQFCLPYRQIILFQCRAYGGIIYMVLPLTGKYLVSMPALYIWFYPLPAPNKFCLPYRQIISFQCRAYGGIIYMVLPITGKYLASMPAHWRHYIYGFSLYRPLINFVSLTG